MNTTTRVIGLISGTSVDGIDAAIVDISGTDIDLDLAFLAGTTIPYPEDLRQQILAVCAGTPLTMEALANLDDAIAHQFAQAALAIQAEHSPAVLIGSHGQTVFHRPPNYQATSSSLTALGYTLQLGRGAVIAEQTGITTISNFRVADIAAGGQGAPLVSRLDAYWLSHPTQSRCIQNLGGIGNVTYLPSRQDPHWLQAIQGWDTGPSNVLLDLAVHRFSQGQLTYDRNGDWAAQGAICYALVEQWLQHPFFLQPPPKSTGRELFGPDYLNQCLADAAPYNLEPADILATLTELTSASIVRSYQAFLPQLPDEVILCGGGSLNHYLMRRISHWLGSKPVLTTDDLGLPAAFKEAIAFAVLAYWQQRGIPGNLPQVTGASQDQCLGETNLANLSRLRYMMEKSQV